jgi:hypothetical protein
VQLVFSSTVKPQPGGAVTVQKILMTNDRKRTAAAVVELYTLRWPIELFFKELQSTLGLHQYRFRRFRQVDAWVQACLIAFVYLAWYRAGQLRRRDLDDAALVAGAAQLRLGGGRTSGRRGARPGALVPLVGDKNGAEETAPNLARRATTGR